LDNFFENLILPIIRSMRILGFLMVMLVFWSCHPGRASQEDSLGLFSGGEELGVVDLRLEEASGLVASIKNPGYLWTMNDSGNPAEVFLLDSTGNIKMVCKLANILNRDWEEIAIGPGPEKGKNYLYVADIGDNLAQYAFKYIYRFEEPALSKGQEKLITKFDTLVLRMPDGRRDAEAMLLDPLNNDLFIVSKQEDSVGLYRARYPFIQDTIRLEKVLTMPFTQIAAGSVSADGNEVLLKDYAKIYYWKRSSGESLPALLAKKPMELSYRREPQGEAIAWSRDGSRFYTLSESRQKEKAHLIVHKRR
jgi:hypothetical protein